MEFTADGVWPTHARAVGRKVGLRMRLGVLFSYSANYSSGALLLRVGKGMFIWSSQYFRSDLVSLGIIGVPVRFMGLT